MAYATLAQLRAILTQVPAGSGNDALLNVMLDRATAIIDGQLGFSFAAYGATATPRDVRIRGASTLSGYLDLPAYQAATLTGVTIVTGRGTTAEVETAITDYLAEEDVRPYRLYRDAGWTSGVNYRVTAKWGYGTQPVEIELVCIELAVNLWGARDSKQITDVIGVEGGGAVGYVRGLTNKQRMILLDTRTKYLGVPHA